MKTTEAIQVLTELLDFLEDGNDRFFIISLTKNSKPLQLQLIPDFKDTILKMYCDENNDWETVKKCISNYIHASILYIDSVENTNIKYDMLNKTARHSFDILNSNDK